MKKKPITFCGEMVRAILDGRKTQTRRILKIANSKLQIENSQCPYGLVGDLLWVREKWAVGKCADVFKPRELDPSTWWKDNGGCWYATVSPSNPISPRGKWRSGRFMPKWAARIWLEITGRRAERLQDITEEDAKAEGIGGKDTVTVSPQTTKTYREAFEIYWDNAYSGRWKNKIHKEKHLWQANPWIWVIEFKRINHGFAP